MGGMGSAIMVALGYPGEIQNSLGIRWLWWALAMVPFCYVVFTLVAGLNDATDKQPESAMSLVAAARYVTAISWLTYPFVYIIKSCGLAGSIATTLEQVGYSIADFLRRQCSVSSFMQSQLRSLRKRKLACLSEFTNLFVLSMVCLNLFRLCCGSTIA